MVPVGLCVDNGHKQANAHKKLNEPMHEGRCRAPMAKG